VLYLWPDASIDRRFTFGPIRELGIKTTPDNLFFMWEEIGHISAGIRHVYSRPREVDNSLILLDRYIIVEDKDKPSMYTDLYIGEQVRYTVSLIRRKPMDYKTIAKTLKLPGAEFGKGESTVPGKAKTILGYLRKIDQMVKENGLYKSHSRIKYSEWRATDEWIADYKRSIIESTAAWKRKNANKIFYRRPSGSSGEMTEWEFKVAD